MYGPWIRIAKDARQKRIGCGNVQKFITPNCLFGDDPVQLVLPLHKKALEVTPFKSVLFDWNLTAIPPGVLDVLILMFIFIDFRGPPGRQIQSTREAMAQFDNYPPPGYPTYL